MNNLFSIFRRKVQQKVLDAKREELKKICLEQFEKLRSKGISLPITLL